MNAVGPLLDVRNLSAAYGRKSDVLTGVDISVEPGSIVALLGANGAGKTTLIRAIAGLLPLHHGTVSTGTVAFCGVDIRGLSTDRIVRMGVGQVPEGRMVFKNLTVEDNLRVGAAVLPRAAGKEKIDAVYRLFPRLQERKEQQSGLLSGGEQQMLAIGRALASAPKIVLIDELSLGLAPLIVKSIYEALGSIRQTFGTAILVIEQNARLALKYCDRAYVLERGHIVLSGSAAELASNDSVERSYLGVATVGGRGE